MQFLLLSIFSTVGAGSVSDSQCNCRFVIVVSFADY